MTELKEKISEYSDKRPIPVGKIAEAIAKSTLTLEDNDYQTILYLAQLDDLFDEYFSSPAMSALPGWGERGIDQLLEFAFDDNKKLKTRSRALEVMLVVSRGMVPKSRNIKYLEPCWDEVKKYDLSQELANYCLFSLRERLLIAFEDEYEKSNLLYFLGTMAQFSGTGIGGDMEDLDYFLSLIIDNQLILNLSTIQKFEDLINSSPKHEEKLQQFLTGHPVILDPFVSELFTKQKLGSDFITDYVVKRTNNQYVLVEIENSTDKLFNQNGSFTSSLIEAISQVRDFQAWISDNLAYAQKKLPEIKHPEGLVVIGRGCNLNKMQKKRLAEENYSRRGHIKIVTYDDLLETANSVYKNIIERPLVITTKDTKSI